MKTLTIYTTAWLTPDSSPGILSEEPCNTQAIISGTALSSYDMCSVGWSKIGPASLTIEVPELNELIDFKVEALRKEVQLVRANAEVKATELEQKIQTLLALPFTPVSPAGGGSSDSEDDIPF